MTVKNNGLTAENRNLPENLDESAVENVTKPVSDLKSRSELYNSLLEQFGDGVFVADPAGNYIEVNSAGCRMLGYTPEEILRLNIADVIDPSETERIAPEVARFVDGRMVISTWKFLRKDGTTFIGLVRGRKVSDGKLQGVLVDITNREQSDSMIRESESKLRGLFELSPFGIVLTDMQGRYLEFNQAFLDICGYSEAELKALDYWTLTPKKYQQQELRQLELLRSTGQYGPYEKEYLRSDGSLIALQLNGMLITGKDDRQYIWSIVQDISERKQIEVERQTVLELLSVSEAKLKAIFDCSPEPIIISDEAGTIAMINRQVTRLLGYTVDELIGAPIEMLMPSRYRHPHVALRNGFEFGTSARAMAPNREVKACHKDGSEVDIEISLSSIQIQNRRLIVSSLHDLTERKRAERIIKESEYRFFQLMESMSEGYTVIDYDMRYTYQNKTAALHSRSEPGQLTGKKVMEAHPGAENGELFSALQRVMSSRVAETIETSVTFQNGTKAWFDLRIAPVMEGVSVLSVETTQRRQIELELEQKRSFVTYLSRLAILGELSGAIAHELNQPLMSILMNAESAKLLLASKEQPLDEISEILTEIVDEDVRASGIIQRLRKLFAQQEVINRQVDINELITEVGKILKNELVNRGVHLQLRLDAAIPAVNLDRIQIEQVLINLIINACDAMACNSTNREKIVICMTGIDQNGVRVSVLDNGAGIPAELLVKIFDPFFTTKQQGMGLGLSICRTIVNAHSGALWAENNPDGGSSFHFTLPVLVQP